LGEYVQKLVKNKAPQWDDSSTTNPRSENGGFSMNDAVTTALNGGNWQDGANKMPSLAICHDRLHGHTSDESIIENNMFGFAPNVGAYLSGAPDNMMSFETAPTGDKLLRVAVHVGRIWSSEQHQVLNRGAAIMAVLDQLSREGFNIELWAIWRNDDDGEGISVETCIKHGNDFWTPSSVAFALCHIAFQRRLCWRVAESVERGQAGYGLSGYGTGMSADFSDFDLSFGYVTEALKYDTLDKALTTIKTSTDQQLKALAQKEAA